MLRPSLKPLALALAGRLPICGALMVTAAGASAQSAPGGSGSDPATSRAFSITPSFSAGETLTDNGNLASGDDKHAELITTLSPGLHVRSNAGRITGFLDYSLNSLVYGHGTSQNQLQNALNAAATAEAIENWAFIDVNAGISQQSISAFGKQSVDPTLDNSNRTEVATYNISPYVRGNLGGWAGYEVRLSRGATKSDDIASGFDSTTSSASARLNGGTALTLLNWSANASRTITRYGVDGSTGDTLAQVGLNYVATPELKLLVNAGYESDNLASTQGQTGATYGGGFDWHPTERTTVAADIGHRLFGDSHHLRLEHRTPRTVWSYTDTQDVVTGNGQPTAASLGTAYNLLMQQFTSQYPDENVRNQQVLAYLQARGINPNATVLNQFLSNSVSVQRNQALSFSLLGVRDDVIVMAARTEARQLQNNSGATDDFNASKVIHQTGVSVDFTHRLTPQASINLVLAQQRTAGESGADGSTLRSLLLNWSSQIGRRTFVSLGARHSEYESPASPYTETALIASLRLDF